MRPAVRRSLLGLTVAWSVALGELPAQTAQRAAPTRPGALTPPPPKPAPAGSNPSAPVSRSSAETARRTAAAGKAAAVAAAPARGNVTVTEIAGKFGLETAWPEPGRKVVLSDPKRRLVLEAGSRECQVNGQRVFLGDPVLSRRGQLLVSEIDFTTCLVPLLKPSLIPGVVPRRPKVIALDPGHGGNDDGAGNPRLKLKEKTLTLDVAKRLQKRLERDGYRVVLTRESDVRVDLPSRAIIANRAGADLFISIHFNALPNDQKTRGTEVFTFAPQHQRSTNSWGALQTDDTERESAPGNRKDPWNSLLAHALHRELLESLKTFDRGKKIGHLGVLRGLNCPGVLVESAFLSNDEEARQVATPGYRQEIADALAKAIHDYAAQLDSLRRK